VDGGPAGRQGYVVTMLTRVLVIMVMRCCNMTSSSNCPSEKAKEFDLKPHKTNVMVLSISKHAKSSHTFRQCVSSEKKLLLSEKTLFL